METSFVNLMARLMEGKFNDDLPPTIERAGFLTPACLVQASLKSDDFNQALVEAAIMAIRRVHADIEARLSDSDLQRLSTQILGEPLTRSLSPPRAEIQPHDLVVVRLPFRVELFGRHMQLQVWNDIKPCLHVTKFPSGQATAALAWPRKDDQTQTHWPLRYFTEAVALGAFLRTQRSETRYVH